MQKIRTISLCGLLFITSFSSQAITPIDTKENPNQGWGGSVGIGLEGESGTKDEQEYAANLILRHVKEQRTALLLSNYNYAETNDVKDEDDLFVHGRWTENNFFRPMLDWELFAQYQYDKFDDLSSRELLGSGVRWRFEDKSDEGKLYTSLGAGGFFEHEESDSQNEENNNWRGNFYAKWVWDRADAFPYTLYGQLYLQPVLDDLGDLRATGSGGIKFGITEALALHLEAEVEYDSEPFEEAEETNWEYAIKLSYSFD
ncbi:DUF481 domain-containing protein [Corallincola spongiicola]|uniref:DUF481 domain-containing protein n=1 Tax=Corallincola spongiicola TaxID=2520508 RepID=A0ABY1WVD9_9GAMM|nr:DUF481 domain-containing protein [Corallincola spongiicola]TAA48694.1 DUF481 domain-containing protein [Corallincola spongiicola]